MMMRRRSDRQDDVHHPHQQVVHPAAEVAGDRADRHPDEDDDEDGREAMKSEVWRPFARRRRCLMPRLS